MTWLGPHSWIVAEQPGYLALLALVPLLVVVSYRSLAGLGPVRRWLALIVRLVVVVMLVFTLAGLHTVRETDDETAVFVLDTSASVSRDLQQRGFEFAQQAAQTMRKGKDRIALVAFNGAPSVEQLAGDNLAIDHFTAAPQPQGTNVAAGVRFATAILPPDTARRLVVLSDGNENAGDAMVEADQLRSAGIPVDVVSLAYQHEHEVVFERLSAPATARLDETVNLNANLRATAAQRGAIRVYHNDRLIDLDPAGPGTGMRVQLDPGPNRLTIPVPLRAQGMHRFRAVFEPAGDAEDTILQNNETQSFTLVGGPQCVLILDGLTSTQRPDERESARLLAAALKREAIECDLRSVGEMQLTAPALMEYSCVVLNNVSAVALESDGMDALASYVRDLGGGLVVIGGDQAFSMGGYLRTPLEEVLPVQTDRAKMKFLSLSMMIVIDRSGSMTGEKIELAKSAAAGAVALLGNHDQIGIVTFNSAFDWAVPLAPCSDKRNILRNIHQIGAGGGTDMYPALEQAVEALDATDSNLRHIILLTDGQSTPGDSERLANRMKTNGITLSAIAVGNDADRGLLAHIAETTGGRMYVTDSAKPLPAIFARETVLASRSGMYERRFAPTLRTSTGSPLVVGLRADELPPLNGYVISAAKPLAQAPIVRVTEDGADPILANWRVGLGRSVAFTSGMWPRWGADWVSWPAFSKFWAQTVRWAARPENSTDFATRIAIDGNRATLIMDASAALDTDRVSLRLDGQMVDPTYQAHPLSLHQTGPTRYECDFPLNEFGNYVVRVAYSAGADAGARSGVVQAGLSYSYSPEWTNVQSNDALLTEVARRTEGRVLDLTRAAAVYEPSSIRPVETRRPIWGDLLRLALILFVIDVAVRRIAITPKDAAKKMRGYIGELAGKPATVSAETMATLRGARQRVRTATDAPPPPARAKFTSKRQAPSAMSNDPADWLRADANLHDPPSPKPPVDPSTKPDAAAGDYAARLRAAKRRARGQDDDAPNSRR